MLPKNTTILLSYLISVINFLGFFEMGVSFFDYFILSVCPFTCWLRFCYFGNKTPYQNKKKIKKKFNLVQNVRSDYTGMVKKFSDYFLLKVCPYTPWLRKFYFGKKTLAKKKKIKNDFRMFFGTIYNKKFLYPGVKIF